VASFGINKDLERVGCLLPWEEGEEVRSRILQAWASDVS
jgi:hypothetical protein